MNSENANGLDPEEVLNNWKLMNRDEKVDFLTNPTSETIAILIKVFENFDKPRERTASLREKRNEALIEWLNKGDRSIDEVGKIADLMDKSIKEQDEADDKSGNQKIKLAVALGGIASIIGGSCLAKSDKKTGAALIAAGSAALAGVVGSETKIGKALLDFLSDTQSSDVVEI